MCDGLSSFFRCKASDSTPNEENRLAIQENRNTIDLLPCSGLELECFRLGLALGTPDDSGLAESQSIPSPLG
ncbi:MAG: hypothetical protein ACKO22_03135 [Cyanobium sp.]